MAIRLAERALRGAVLAFLALQGLAVAALWMRGVTVDRRLARAAVAHDALAAELQLTDLALFSEASYCRHPTGADLFAAHADHPGALEHFPAGSVVPPPHARQAFPVHRGAGP